jgi:5-methylcytosine-specific restriction endonuclease McrA
MEGRSLLLNASFQPLQVVSWQKAIQLFFSGKVEIVEASDQTVRSVSLTVRMPLVVRLLKYVPQKSKRNVVKFTRNNVFLRDHYACQYCKAKPPLTQLTMDHVVPVVKGGGKSWENIVTACRTCNLKKGGRTPEEANMRLPRVPRQPIWLPFMGLNIDFTNSPEYIRVLVTNYTGTVQFTDEDDPN